MSADIDRRLNDIDDCLYRVAARVLIVQDEKLLLVRELEGWWAFPGGGVDHGESVESSVAREVEEELGVPADELSSDFRIVYYNIGSVVKGVPRMNLFFKASIPEGLLNKTTDIVEWAWFTREEFLELDVNPSYDKVALAGVVFDE